MKSSVDRIITNVIITSLHGKPTSQLRCYIIIRRLSISIYLFEYLIVRQHIKLHQKKIEKAWSQQHAVLQAVAVASSSSQDNDGRPQEERKQRQHDNINGCNNSKII
jgi:hypothetical protein